MIEVKITFSLGKEIPIFEVSSVHWIHEFKNLHQANRYAEKMLVTYSDYDPVLSSIEILSEKAVQLTLF